MVSFTCELNKPNVEVTWTHKGQTLEQGSVFEIRSDKHIRYLTIFNAQLDLSGEYTVQAKDKSATANLTVDGKLNRELFIFEMHGSVHCSLASDYVIMYFPTEKPAEFTLRLKDQRVSETDTAEFTVCLNKPNIQAVWKKNDTEILPDERVKIINEDLTYKLAITDCQLTDADTYSVTLPNGQTCAAKLVVDGKLLIVDVL